MIRGDKETSAGWGRKGVDGGVTSRVPSPAAGWKPDPPASLPVREVDAVATLLATKSKFPGGSRIHG